MQDTAPIECCIPQPWCTHTHLLNHANELGEGPVELVQDTVEEAGGQVTVTAEQVCHVPLQQGGGTRL